MQETATSSRLCDLIRHGHDDILADWQAAVRALPQARHVPRPQLIDHVPALLEDIALHLEGCGGPIENARKHAIARLEEGFDLVHVVAELGILRECVLDKWSHLPMTPMLLDDVRRLDHAIDSSIQEAVARFTHTRDRMLNDAAAQSEKEHHFLDEASRALGSSLDHQETLEKLADLAVPERADWCVVDVVEDGQLRRVATAHADRRKLAFAHDWARRYPLDPESRSGPPEVVRTGRPELHADLDNERIAKNARSPEHARELRELGIRSVMIVPLTARGRTLGALTMISTRGDRQYTEQDLRIALELGVRAGLALDNARLYQEANRAIKIREDILAVVSHDLRNPLGAIDLAASMLVQNHGAEPRSRRHLDVIRRSTDRMTGLISDLLDMASLQAGRLSVDRKTVAVAPLLAEVLDTHEPVILEKGIELVRELSIEGLELHGDHDRLVQVFGNLLGNATKFCAPGDTIIVRGYPEDGSIRFEVEDTGPGIPESELPRIFEPYWSAQRHAKKGTGLGLYISKGIVEAHGGRLWVNSSGKGATFCMTIPRIV
jgi:signal transduction histidine kinase